MHFSCEIKTWTWNPESNGSISSNTKANHHIIVYCVLNWLAYLGMISQPITGIEEEVQKNNLIKKISIG